MTADAHFVQAGGGPILIGAGTDTLCCQCGNTLIQGYAAARFLAISIQCAGCRAITTTPPLHDGELPPRSAIVAVPSAEPRPAAVTLPPNVAIVGQAEMERLRAMVQPAAPDNIYHLSPAILDEAVAAFERHAGKALPIGEAVLNEPFAGLREHALGWAVRHLRGRMGTSAWACMDDAPTANAVTHVAGFLHFIGTWSHHPLFPAMLATVAGHGCSLHGLALFAAAHCLAMMGNQVSFPAPSGHSERIEGFSLVAGSAAGVGVHARIFDRFEFPFGQSRDADVLRAAVAEAVGAAQAQINLRHPGVLLLSPGAALSGYDEALIEALNTVLQVAGRKNRGLIAVAPVVLRLQASQDPHAVRFGYGFFPIANRHYRGDTLVQMGRQGPVDRPKA